MGAHLTRDGAGPPPPTRNEVLLREAVDRLRRELDTLRPMRELLLHIATDEILTDWQINHARNLLAAYDKAMGGK